MMRYFGGASQPPAGTERAWRIPRGDFAAASAARQEFAAYLHVQAIDTSKLDDAELIFGEIVSNAVRCARSSVEVELSGGSWATLRVIDDGDCFDESRIAPCSPQAEGGRGLYIAKTLARAFSLSIAYGKCIVAVILPVRVPARC